MKKKCLLLTYLLIFGIIFSACLDQMYDPADSVALELKKGKMPKDVEQGDLYGDLWEMERETSGIPVLYELNYRTDYQDQVVTGVIDVCNPRLDGSFELDIITRDEDGYPILTSPTDGTDPVPVTETVTIDPGPDGFLNLEDDGFSPIVLYDAEGEPLAEVALHVFPVEEGRLNIIRSPATVLANRMTELIKNFGDGTVASVIRDFCGRFYMVRTQTVFDSGIEDKPIDSPLENLALYYELMINGFNFSAEENGLNFLVVDDDNGLGGFNFQCRIDNRWGEGAMHYSDIVLKGNKEQFVSNLAAACVAAGSDKSNFITADEIVFLNLFMQIPKAIGNDIDKPADEVICFFPWIEQEVRMMDKTDKHQYSKFRYYVDYSDFSYTRDKFKETLIEFWSIILNDDGEYEKVLMEDNIPLHTILTGGSSLPDVVISQYRYTQEEGQPTTGILGFASQADDYVQALEVVHNNEEFLIWKIPTPTWGKDSPVFRASSPFEYVPPEESHSRKPGGVDDGTSGPPTGNGRS